MKYIVFFVISFMILLQSELEIDAQMTENDFNNSYVFWASDQEEALKIAENYHGELISFENGIGTLAMNRTEAVMTLNNEETESVQVPLYPNYQYTIEETEFISDDEVENRQWHIKYFDMESVWSESTGKDVKIAMVDSGIDTDHIALAEQIAVAESVIPENAYGTNGFFLTYQGPEDRLGHGTHVAGIICADTEDGSVMGIAPECRMYSFKALEKVGNTATGYTSWIANGILRAVENEADVINLSIGGSQREDRFISEAIDIAVESGCIVVCAAGNYIGTGVQDKIDYPAADLDTIAVTSGKETEEGIEIDLSYSKYGEGVDFIAPGTKIYSTIPNDEFGEKKGTSMAAPMVSGMIALALEKNPEATKQEVLELLTETAKDLGDEGKDIYYGNGVIQPLKALESKDPIEEDSPKSPPKPKKPPKTQKEEPEDIEEQELIEFVPYISSEVQQAEELMIVPEKKETTKDAIHKLREEMKDVPIEQQQKYETQTVPEVSREEIFDDVDSQIQEEPENMEQKEMSKWLYGVTIPIGILVVGLVNKKRREKGA